MNFKFNFLLTTIVCLLVSNTQAYRVKEGKVIFDKLEDYSKCQSDDGTGKYAHAALEDWVESHPNDLLKAAQDRPAVQ